LSRFNLNRSLLSSLGIVGIVLLTLSRHSNGTVPLGLTILLGIAYSFIVNGTLPFACEQVPSRHTGLGIGMYFSGAAMAGALFGLVVQFSGKPTPEVAALIGVVGVVGAIGGVLIEGLDGGDR
jgi:drug/metabolite transporter (DMT)-like permease